MARYVMALDQGTTSSRAILFDEAGAVAAVDQYEFPQHFPRPGWVEHDAGDIWDTQLRAAVGALAKAGATASDLAAVGITNQRETALVWDRATGEPLRETNVYWSSEAKDMRSRKTDGEGRLTLELATGSYVFTTDPFAGMPGFENAGDQGVPVLWGPAGPDVERIELNAPAEITFPGDR